MNITLSIAIGAIIEIVANLALITSLVLDPHATVVADGGVDGHDGRWVVIVGGEACDERGLIERSQDEVVVDLELKGHAVALGMRRAHHAMKGGRDVTTGEPLHGLAEHEDNLVGLEEGFDGREVRSIRRENLKTIDGTLGEKGQQPRILMDHALLRASQQLLVVLIAEQGEVGVGGPIECHDRVVIGEMGRGRLLGGVRGTQIMEQ